LTGEAIDVGAIGGVSSDKMIALAKKSGFLYIMEYPEKGFFHLDVGVRNA
jgi:hypothetical protein